MSRRWRVLLLVMFLGAVMAKSMSIAVCDAPSAEHYVQAAETAVVATVQAVVAVERKVDEYVFGGFDLELRTDIPIRNATVGEVRRWLLWDDHGLRPGDRIVTTLASGMLCDAGFVFHTADYTAYYQHVARKSF